MWTILNLLHQVHVLLLVWVPELNIPGRASPGWSEEAQHHLPLPAGHAPPEATQDAVGPLGCKCAVVMGKLGYIASKVSAEYSKLFQ